MMPSSGLDEHPVFCPSSYSIGMHVIPKRMPCYVYRCLPPVFLSTQACPQSQRDVTEAYRIKGPEPLPRFAGDKRNHRALEFVQVCSCQLASSWIAGPKDFLSTSEMCVAQYKFRKG
jgi:hypothetical protein